MRRRLIAALLVVVAAAALYRFVLSDKTVSPQVKFPRAIAAIGSGSSAVAVGADGAILAWLPLPEDESVPQLPLSAPPKDGRLAGPVLQQALILGAAPAALRPYIGSSHYGETGVDVDLSSGIELRFGDASQANRKWRAVAAVLASPSVSALDYVNVQAPRRPAWGGSGHTLPPPP